LKLGCLSEGQCAEGVFGNKGEEVTGLWGILLDDLHPARDIRVKWAGPVARVGVMTDTNRTLARETAVRRECGRTGCRWTANINKVLVAPRHPMKASVRGGRYWDKCAPPPPEFPLSSAE